MNTKRLILILLALLGAFALSACSGAPAANSWHGLAADVERAYIAGGSFVYAVDLKTGNEIWRYPAVADSKLLFYANPVLTSDGQLLIGSAGANHPFISLDPATGKEKWVEPFAKGKSAWMASPLVINKAIYAPNTDGSLYMINLDGKEAAAPVDLGGTLWSPPATDGEFLYITSLDHRLNIINPVTGALQKSIDLGGAAPSSPVIGNAGVYVGSFASTIEFIKPNGEHKVIAKAANWIWGSPVLDGKTLYYADLNGKVYSLDSVSGKENWNSAQKGAIVASPLVVGDRIYVVTEAGDLVAMDQKGKLVWEKPVGGKVYTVPVATSDLILVAPYQTDFALVAYKADGSQAWSPFVPVK